MKRHDPSNGHGLQGHNRGNGAEAGGRALALTGLWAAGCALIYAAMLQTPDTFGRVMARVPMPGHGCCPFVRYGCKPRGP
jgi:hypothetical protein